MGSGYSTLAVNLLKFQDLGAVPIGVPLANLDDGSGIESTLRKNEACWHKSCFNSCSEMKLERAKKRKIETVEDESVDSNLEENVSSVSPIKRTRLRASYDKPEVASVITQESVIKVCFFCNGTDGRMHRASTFDLDNKVKTAAMKTKNWTLLGKLASGDMHAMDVDYHLTCLSSLYNSARFSSESSFKDEKENVNQEAIAFAELTMYIEENLCEGTTVFLLSDLVKLYTTRLEQLSGMKVQGRINSTRLKEKLLLEMPDMCAHTDGREVRITFKEYVGEALRQIHENTNVDDTAKILTRAASLIRKEVLTIKNSFDGSFERGCQAKAAPAILTELLNMIMLGPNIKNQNQVDDDDEESNSDIANTLAQLIVFNSVKNYKLSEKGKRHNRSKETPATIYIAMVTHAETRKKSLVDKFYRLGLCISYDRLMQISTDLGNKVSEQFEKDGLVCPLDLRKDLFTTGCVDNIDHDPSSRTAKDSFHGTAISIHSASHRRQPRC